MPMPPEEHQMQKPPVPDSTPHPNIPEQQPHDSPPILNRPGVIVLGMHRSKTSMLSGLLVEGFGYKDCEKLILITKRDFLSGWMWCFRMMIFFKLQGMG